jgi:hypothetical protein
MAYDEFKYRLLMGILELAGEGFSSFLLKPNYDEQQKVRTEYYAGVKEMVRQEEKTKSKGSKEIELTPLNIDLTTEKIEKGNACLPCSRDHLSTVSGALGEAIRFSRKEGINHPEVQRRLGLSLDELNMLERIDLSPEQMIRLKGPEKQLAEWGLNKSRELRHKLTQVQSHDELEKVAAEASEVRTEFMRKLWTTISVDGSISKLCKGLKEDEFQRCVNTINTILNDKQKIPP